MKDEDKTKEQLIKELKELRQEAQKRKTEFSTLIKSALQEDFNNREERYRTAAQSVSNAIISVDSNGNIIFLNNVAEAMYGYSAEEVLGRPLTLMIPERFREVYQNGIERLISTGKSNIIGKTVELAGLRKDGSEFIVEMYLSSWKIGEKMFFTSNIRDITERKQAEEELRATKEQLESFFNNTADAIAIMDLNGNLLQVNKAFEKIYGWAAYEAVGMKPWV